MTRLTWKRARSDRDELDHELLAVVEGNITIAKIRKDTHMGCYCAWNVFPEIGKTIAHVCATRREAIMCVEGIFSTFLKTHGKTDPQEWPLDQMSIRLRRMREHDISAYRRLVEDLRHGRINRLGQKLE